MAGKIYIVAKGAILTSRADGKNYTEGQEIDLSHCTPEEIQILKNMGKILEKSAVVKEPEKAKE